MERSASEILTVGQIKIFLIYLFSSTNVRIKMESTTSVEVKIKIDLTNLWFGQQRESLTTIIVTVGVVPNSLQDIGRASDGAKRRPVAGGLGRGDLILL